MEYSDAGALRNSISVTLTREMDSILSEWETRMKAEGNPVTGAGRATLREVVAASFDRLHPALAEAARERTERNPAQASVGYEMRNSLRELHQFFAQTPIPMAILSGPDHRHDFVNPGWIQVSGRNPLGQTVRDAFSSAEAGAYLALFDQVYRTGVPAVASEVPFNRENTDGGTTELFLDVHYYPLRGSAGAITGIVAYAIDVTHQVLARREIEATEGRFRALANAVPQILWTATPEGYVDWYNDWWFDYLGVPRGTEWDDPDRRPMHPDDVPPTLAIWNACLASGKHYTMEQRFRRGSDGEYRWHRVSGLPVRDAEGRIVRWVGGNMDIHDQKLLLDTLEEERELRERFVAALSHDLRTPLASAKMGAQLAGRRAEDSDFVRKVSTRVAESLDRADGMIRDLLDANRLKAGEKLSLEITDCDLNAIVTVTLAELSAVHGDRFVFRAEGHVHGRWDRGAVRRILENLCNNAVKYGAVDAPITVSLCPENEVVRIDVHNEGEAIAPEDQSKLFAPFNRTEAAKSSGKKGWGLGLSLVRGLTDAHGGAVSVESAPGRGTTFTVRLPLA